MNRCGGEERPVALGQQMRAMVRAANPGGGSCEEAGAVRVSLPGVTVAAAVVFAALTLSGVLALARVIGSSSNRAPGRRERPGRSWRRRQHLGRGYLGRRHPRLLRSGHPGWLTRGR